MRVRDLLVTATKDLSYINLGPFDVLAWQEPKEKVVSDATLLAKLRLRLGITHDPYRARNQDHFLEQIDPEYESRRVASRSCIKYYRLLDVAKAHLV